jgi:hypothetical protein
LSVILVEQYIQDSIEVVHKFLIELQHS